MPFDKDGNFLMEGDIVRFDLPSGEEFYKVIYTSGREIGVVRRRKNGGFSRRIEFHPSRVFELAAANPDA